MPRAIWSGAISFGLVNVPVKLYSAIQRKTVRFHQIDAESQSRVQQKRVSAKTGEEIPYERIVKGYEIGPERWVTLSPEELEALDPKKTRTIDIQEFVDLADIDPIYYDHTYYLAPDRGADKAYNLLLSAMREAGKVAIARVVIRSKEHLTAIRPLDGVLAMTTMLFADEVVPPEKLDEAPDEKAEAGERELKMARQLVESLTSDFEPEKYRDEYREAVLDLIDRKAQGEEISVEAPEEPKPVPDLMAALEASIAAAARGGDGGGAEKEKEKEKAKPKARARRTSRSSSSRSSSRSSSSDGKENGAKTRSRSKAKK